MSVKSKESERAELHKTIWRIANDLRGSVDGWDFKTYVLGMLFYRFISENLTAYLNEQERLAGNEGFDYRKLAGADAEFGREETVKEKGFYILPQDLFANVREKARHDQNLNETLSRVFKNIEGSAVGANSEEDIKGLFDDLDVNSSKLGPTVAKRNEKLVKLLDAIGDLPLGGAFRENNNDLFGDAYEYLMQMYASAAGKSGGEYYTPQEVAELLARITVVGKTEVNNVYDPACGSGSMLLKYEKVLGHGKVRQGYFGQEVNLTTYNLCRINMFLHDIPYEKFGIAHGDTLVEPAHWDDEPFEAIVSNPPYSIKWDGDANPLLGAGSMVRARPNSKFVAAERILQRIETSTPSRGTSTQRTADGAHWSRRSGSSGRLRPRTSWWADASNRAITEAGERLAGAGGVPHVAARTDAVESLVVGSIHYGEVYTDREHRLLFLEGAGLEEVRNVLRIHAVAIDVAVVRPSSSSCRRMCSSSAR